MTLATGDHLVIKRDGRVLGPEDEAYHEYEVMNVRYYPAPASEHAPKQGVDVQLEVVK